MDEDSKQRQHLSRNEDIGMRWSREAGRNCCGLDAASARKGERLEEWRAFPLRH